jgi:Helix-turn-helix domain
VNKIPVDEYVLTTLLADLVGHDRAPSAFLVYLAIWARTRGRRGAFTPASYATLAEDTGLSKSAVQSGIRRLAQRKLIAAERASATATPRYAVLRPWIRR